MEEEQIQKKWVTYLELTSEADDGRIGREIKLKIENYKKYPR